MHKFLVPVVDTDSITISKIDGLIFTENEIESLTSEINELTDELIRWDFEFNAEKMIVIKSKNYIIHNPNNKKKPLTIKGSALKMTQKEIALKELINRCIDVMINTIEMDDIKAKCQALYLEYIKEAVNISDIKRWSKRITISSKTMESTRTNETKIIDALQGTEFSEGDRVYMYFKPDDSLGLASQFDGTYNVDKMLKKCYDTACVFETVLPIKELFLNYSLKKNKKLLEGLVNGNN